MNDPMNIRASDAEREAVVEQLRVASVDGRLTFGELTDRTEAAYTAVTLGELRAITADLPGSSVAPHAPAYPAREGAPRRGRRWFVAVMGDTKRRGRWKVDQELGAVAVMGDVLLDLRETELISGEVDIAATAIMGDVTIIVPDGVDVDVSGISIMGDKRVKVAEAPPGRTVPRVRVNAFVLMGDVKVLGEQAAEKRSGTMFRAWREHWKARIEASMHGYPPPLPPPHVQEPLHPPYGHHPPHGHQPPPPPPVHWS
ncbi:DUF1707 SHOCT-like domain-containing protein [Rhizohabitans arisaemae]|uniref:DUF1707 SHOCT-like domain-containing protein n=1 Tax=Rhizohabitans arisaemae TaxID=2720610 RepID=UPI0024B14C4E|nr:DUF1707 domain-containing protein [Rhizohabitans arisaemae]